MRNAARTSLAAAGCAPAPRARGHQAGPSLLSLSLSDPQRVDTTGSATRPADVAEPTDHGGVPLDWPIDGDALAAGLTWGRPLYTSAEGRWISASELELRARSRRPRPRPVRRHRDGDGDRGAQPAQQGRRRGPPRCRRRRRQRCSPPTARWARRWARTRGAPPSTRRSASMAPTRRARRSPSAPAPPPSRSSTSARPRGRRRRSFSVAITDNGQASRGAPRWGWAGRRRWEQRWVAAPPRGGRVAAVAAGDRHALLLLDNGEVYGFGDDDVGQLGGVVPRASARRTRRDLSVPKPKAIAAARCLSSSPTTAKSTPSAERRRAAGQRRRRRLASGLSWPTPKRCPTPGSAAPASRRSRRWRRGGSTRSPSATTASCAWGSNSRGSSARRTRWERRRRRCRQRAGAVLCASQPFGLPIDGGATAIAAGASTRSPSRARLKVYAWGKGPPRWRAPTTCWSRRRRPSCTAWPARSWWRWRPAPATAGVDGGRRAGVGQNGVGQLGIGCDKLGWGAPAHPGQPDAVERPLLVDQQIANLQPPLALTLAELSLDPSADANLALSTTTLAGRAAVPRCVRGGRHVRRLHARPGGRPVRPLTAAPTRRTAGGCAVLGLRLGRRGGGVRAPPARGSDDGRRGGGGGGRGHVVAAGLAEPPQCPTSATGAECWERECLFTCGARRVARRRVRAAGVRAGVHARRGSCQGDPGARACECIAGWDEVVRGCRLPQRNAGSSARATARATRSRGAAPLRVRRGWTGDACEPPRASSSPPSAAAPRARARAPASAPRRFRRRRRRVRGSRLHPADCDDGRAERHVLEVVPRSRSSARPCGTVPARQRRGDRRALARRGGRARRASARSARWTPRARSAAGGCAARRPHGDGRDVQLQGGWGGAACGASVPRRVLGHGACELQPTAGRRACASRGGS